MSAIGPNSEPRTSSTCVTVACIGIDGSGKSTAARGLAERLSADGKAALLSDALRMFADGDEVAAPRLLGEALRRGIGAYAKHAASLKQYKVPKMAELLLRDRVLRQMRDREAAPWLALDGAPLLNIVGWGGVYHADIFDATRCAAALHALSGREPRPADDDPVYGWFPELLTLRRGRFDHLAVPDVVVFLDVPATVAIQRIAARGAARQVHEETARLTQLHRAYGLVCDALAQDFAVPVLRLDAALAVEQVSEAAAQHARRHAGRSAAE